MSAILEEEFQSKLDLALSLLQDLADIEQKGVSGVNKLRSKIEQDLVFLNKVKQSGNLKKEHLASSNIHHYSAIVSYVKQSENCVSLLEVFKYEDEDAGKKKISVDVVSCGKSKWTKVIARNPKALSQILKGEGEYLKKSVMDHASQYLTAASQNSVFFSPPVIEFYFACGLEKEVAQTLEKIGIQVSGKVIDIENNSLVLSRPIDYSSPDTIKKLNLGVTAMIAYVSALTNGNCHVKLKGKILSQLAEWERARPVKPVLDSYFRDKELYACKTAVEKFQGIVDAIGGPGEQQRAKSLLPRIHVVDDVPCTSLSLGGQIKSRSLIIFGTGQAIHAITVTANTSFVRAAQQQGVRFDVLFHEARALTERKEIH
ncbi:Protein of unknown function (DUF1308) [Nesidiocoris tenuis]|uniref:DUF1308 domain-containing protein n=1 Tax=Nesidiocoris tenuis TaxID=355587 RepID=A0ABN7AW42_9HEMI|nr:Protein of unknown function (DUF1308) [Nesidiocoris tenuis]